MADGQPGPAVDWEIDVESLELEEDSRGAPPPTPPGPSPPPAYEDDDDAEDEDDVDAEDEGDGEEAAASPGVPGRPGSAVYGIFQARILEWVVISFPRRSS